MRRHSPFLPFTLEETYSTQEAVTPKIPLKTPYWEYLLGHIGTMVNTVLTLFAFMVPQAPLSFQEPPTAPPKISVEPETHHVTPELFQPQMGQFT